VGGAPAILALLPLAVGFVWWVCLVARTRDARLLLPGLLLGGLAARHALAPIALEPGAGPLDPETLRLAVRVLVDALAVAGLVALERTLRERDRSERLQWERMEALRALRELAERPRGPAVRMLRDTLEAGARLLELKIGLVFRTRREPRLLAHVAPQALAAAELAGLASAASEAVTTSRPLRFERARLRPGGDDALPGFETVLACAVAVEGERFGTLCFAGRTPRRRRVASSDVDLLLLLAHEIGRELELGLLRQRRAAAPPRPPAPHEDGRRAARRAAAPGSVPVNAAVRSLESRLRAVPGEAVPELRLHAGVSEARLSRRELERVLLGLVAAARRVARPGERLTVETGSVEPALPAPAPQRGRGGNGSGPHRSGKGNGGNGGNGAGGHGPGAQAFVTLSVRGSARTLGAEALGRLFEADAPGSNGGAPSLAGLQLLLRRRGGDLSVESAPARGTSFVAYLPAADVAAATVAEAATVRARPAAPLAAPPLPN